MNLEERKKEIKNIALTKGEVGAMIYDLINKGDLDHIITKITDVKTKCFKNEFCEKGYFNGNEQFYSVLEQYIFIFQRYFACISYKQLYISMVLKNKTPKFLLCKNYWGNNDFIEYYQYNIKKNLVENFYYNIMYLFNYPQFSCFFKEIGIKKNFSLRNGSHVDIIFEFMHSLVWCNYCEYGLFAIFENLESLLNYQDDYEDKQNERKNATIRNFMIQWERLIDNYNNKIEAVNVILENNNK